MAEGEHRASWWQRLRQDTKALLICMSIIIGLLVVQTIYFGTETKTTRDRQDALAVEQRQCLAQQIKSLTDALNARSDLSSKLSDATNRVLNSFANAAASGDAEPNPQPIVRALENYDKVQREVEEERGKNPYPEYPTGVCVKVPSNESDKQKGEREGGDALNRAEQFGGDDTSDGPTSGSSTDEGGDDGSVSSSRRSGNNSGGTGSGDSGGGSVGGSGGGGGGGGGDTPDPPPQNPPPPEPGTPALVNIPNVLKVKVDVQKKPPIKVEILP